MLSQAEQEALFKQLKAAHPRWTDAFVSGYVHGVADESFRGSPMLKGRVDPYGKGYLLGFALHFGEDAELASWFGALGE